MGKHLPHVRADQEEVGSEVVQEGDELLDVGEEGVEVLAAVVGEEEEGVHVGEENAAVRGQEVEVLQNEREVGFDDVEPRERERKKRKKRRKKRGVLARDWVVAQNAKRSSFPHLSKILSR